MINLNAELTDIIQIGNTVRFERMTRSPGREWNMDKKQRGNEFRIVLHEAADFSLVPVDRGARHYQDCSRHPDNPNWILLMHAGTEYIMEVSSGF